MNSKNVNLELKWLDSIANCITDYLVKVCPKWIFLRTKQ